MNKLFRSTLIALLALAVPLIATAQSVVPKYESVWGGRFLASSYANWSVKSLNAVSAGAGSMTLNSCYPIIGSDNRTPVFTALFNLDVPLIIVDGSNTETVTPTAITTPTAAGPSTVNSLNCGFTATFANAHGVNVTIVSGDSGLMEAVNDASAAGSSLVTIDQSSGVNAATLVAAVFSSTPAIPGNMIVEYLKPDAPQRWTVVPASLSTALATPTTATTSATCSSSVTVCIPATTGGTFANSTYHVGFVYVDLLGNFSTGSSDATLAAGATGTATMGFTAPAASAGAGGWLPAAGTTLAAEYILPVTASNCVVSKVVTQFPVCAIGANAVMLGPSTTGPLRPVAGGLAAAYNPNPNSHTTFTFGVNKGPAGVQSNYGPFTIAPALTAGQATVIGTVPLPYVGYLNSIFRTLRITGRLTVTPSTGGTDQIIVGIGDVTDFTTGTPKAVCTETETTAITTAAQDQPFTCVLTVNAIGTTGSIMPSGWACLQVQAGTTAAACSVESATAAITADVLDWDLLYIEFLQTSAAETTTPPQLQDLHIEEL